MDELEVVRRARPQVPPPSPEALSRIETDLQAAIQDERPKRRRRLWYLPSVAALSVAVVVTVIVFGIGPQNGPTAVPPAAAVEITTDGDYLEVRFLDLSAEEDTIEAAIREAGLDVDINLVPVSPSLVGTLVASSETPRSRDTIAWEYTAPSEAGVPSAVRVPTSYQGVLSLTIGRPAQPGESYASAAISAELPGELLHCGSITGATASHAANVATERGVTVRWVDDTTRKQLGTQLPSRYGDWYVIATAPIVDDEVRVELGPAPPEDGRTPEFKEALQAGC